MHVLTRSYILIYVLAVEVDAWFVPTAAELRGITTKIKSDQPDPEIQKIEIAKAGGTSWIGVGLVLMGTYFAVRLLYYFLHEGAKL